MKIQLTAIGYAVLQPRSDVPSNATMSKHRIAAAPSERIPSTWVFPRSGSVPNLIRFWFRFGFGWCNSLIHLSLLAESYPPVSLVPESCAKGEQRDINSNDGYQHNGKHQ